MILEDLLFIDDVVVSFLGIAGNGSACYGLPARKAYSSERSSIPRANSIDVSMMASKPKIFCLRFGFRGSLRTPILASISAGSLGH